MNFSDLHSRLAHAEALILKGEFQEAESSVLAVMEEISGLDGSDEAIRVQVEELRAAALISQSRLAYRRGEYEEALRQSRAALVVAESNNLALLKAQALNATGAAYLRLSDLELAFSFLKQALEINEDLGIEEEVARNLVNIGNIHYHTSDYPAALEYYKNSLFHYEKCNAKDGLATCITNIGLVYYNLSDLSLGLEYLLKAMALYEELGSNNGMAGSYHNIGLVYSDLKDNQKAMEYFRKAENINLQTGNKAWLAINYDSLGSVQTDPGEALEYYKKSLKINEEIGSKENAACNLTNIGWDLYKNYSDYENSIKYSLRALQLYEKTGVKEGVGRSMCNIGVIYSLKDFKGYDAKKAEHYLYESLKISRELGSKKEEHESCKWIANFFKRHERWREAFEYLELALSLEKELQGVETKKQLVQLDLQRQAAESEKKIAVESAKAQVSMELLHRTLPNSIADRLMQGEESIADHFHSASILFADVVGFTQLSVKLSPSTVLGFMNFIFERFDSIASKYECERIKTIGDGYMAVCGAPVANPHHVELIARMALEMMHDIRLPEDLAKSLPAGTRFRLRIGLHCGEVTAGLIGTGKLAYDIYGDAVNTASRMESHGEAGRIQVSSDFVSAAEGTSLIFTPRGEMEIKGKGMMKTYFLEG